jgi:hypothetical protein
MKIILSTTFFTCFLSFFATAQYSVGVNTYYNIGSFHNSFNHQIMLGFSASKQISTYFDTKVIVSSVFSQKKIVDIVPLERTECGTESSHSYEGNPSSYEMSCLIRFRPIVRENKERITLGTGLMYRYLQRSILPSEVSGKQFLVLAPNLNYSVGIPLNIGAELDLNKHFSLSLEEENRFFIYCGDKTKKDLKPNFFYYGASLNLVYRLFPKK